MRQDVTYCGHSRAVFAGGKVPARQIYIFYLFFQFTMIPETTKDPGSICTIASASQVFLICIILPVTFIQSIFLPLSEFHIALDAEAHSVQPVQIDVSWL